jgi:hypothetical protein
MRPFLRIGRPEEADYEKRKSRAKKAAEVEVLGYPSNHCRTLFSSCNCRGFLTGGKREEITKK